MDSRRYVDLDLLVVGGLVGFAVAIAAAFLPELLALPVLAIALAGAVVLPGVLGRRRGGLHRAVFVGLASVAGGTLASRCCWGATCGSRNDRTTSGWA